MHPSGKLVVLLYMEVLLGVTAACVVIQYDRTVSFKPANTIGQQLFKLKDKADPFKMSGAVYKVGCKNCDMCYIGETIRALYAWQREHREGAEKATNT